MLLVVCVFVCVCVCVCVLGSLPEGESGVKLINGNESKWYEATAGEGNCVRSSNMHISLS